MYDVEEIHDEEENRDNEREGRREINPTTGRTQPEGQMCTDADEYDDCKDNLKRKIQMTARV